VKDRRAPAAALREREAGGDGGDNEGDERGAHDRMMTYDRGGARSDLWPMIAIAGSRALLRPEERALVATAGAVFALASAGAAMTTAVADAMFLVEIGPSRFGEAIAVSSALLAIVLAVVGGLADQLERRRVLAGLAAFGAIVVAALAIVADASPHAAVIAFVGGKQLAAAADLAFWVAIAERVDARRSPKVLPVLAAAGGAGAALGALVLVPAIGAAAGSRGVLAGAAVMLALAAFGAARLPATGRVAAPQKLGTLVARSWRDGARATARHPLALHLAILVAIAGVFGALVYVALGVAVAATTGSTVDYAQLLGVVRGASQLATLAVQLVVVPRVLARAGTGRTLVLAPLVALAAATGLAIVPVLAVAMATQFAARVVDAGIETPAEKVVQTLLPTALRGRIAGFLDGTAKRAGAVLGGIAAALLAGAPTAFTVAIAAAAALWLVAAARIARELPALAIARAGEAAGEPIGAVVDDRAIASLVGELAGPRPERAAEVLSRLPDRAAVVAPLARAACATTSLPVWRSLVVVLAPAAPQVPAGETPAAALGPELYAAAARATSPRVRELAIRAVGLAGGVAAADIEKLAVKDAGDALAVRVALLRLADDRDGELAELGDAVREGGGAALDELVVAIARAHARDDTDRALAAARHLQRALRRDRGDVAGRAAALTALAAVAAHVRDQRSAELSLLRADLLELVRDRVDRAASPPAPEGALVSLVRPAKAIDSGDDAPEIAAAIRLYGALLDGADAVLPDDLRRVARALGEPDDAIRAAAEAALAALGPAAAGELIATAAWGRRRARDRAAALLAELPVTPATIDRLVDAELDALDQTGAAHAAMTEPGDELVARRLDERLREIAHTVLLLVAARRRSRAIARAAVAWRRARGKRERARALAVIDAALPHALRTRLVDAVDDIAPVDRAAQLVVAGARVPARDAVIRAELAGRDRLARALVLHVIGASGRSVHRATIARAAHAEALAASPVELMRRLAAAMHDRDDERDEGADMPSQVETLIAIGRVPLLAQLTTRQLADVAERARWTTARQGAVVVAAGETFDALIVVVDGELAIGERRIVGGDVVDELACVAPLPLVHDVVAVRAARLVRVDRADFEELVDDVPGLAAAVCRALGERARRADDRNYKSPLVTRP
jgi:hypothetical protein